MLALLSPAKTLDFDPVAETYDFTEPDLLNQSKELVEVSRQLKSADLMKLMNISRQLADLNVRRFKAFSTPFSTENAKAAIFAFRGDTYMGFDVDSLDRRALDYAQRHVRILSGLYGLLRPLDLIQPYRLEMGIKLKTERGKDLYSYWGSTITQTINRALGPKAAGAVVNLASNEYIKSVKRDQLSAPFVDCVFKEVRGGQAKVMGLAAKRARGMMARFMCQERVTKIEQLKDFGAGGYEFQPKSSSASVLEFHRAS